VERTSNPDLGCLVADSPFSCITWNENLTFSGQHAGTKLTSPNGFTLSPAVQPNLFLAVGTMTTTIDGQTYTQSANGT
jgi:hypothetical protein